MTEPTYPLPDSERRKLKLFDGTVKLVRLARKGDAIVELQEPDGTVVESWDPPCVLPCDARPAKSPPGSFEIVVQPGTPGPGWVESGA